MENQNKVRADLRQLIPFFIVAFVGIIYHLRIRPMAGDDVFFSQATSELGLWNYLIVRYETWTMSYSARFCGESLIFCCLRRCRFCCPGFSAAGRR